MAEGKEAATVEGFGADLRAHRGRTTQIDSVSIDMSPAFIRGVTDRLPNAQITFDELHVIAHTSEAIDKMRRLEQKLDPSLKGLRWVLLNRWCSNVLRSKVEPMKEVAEMIRTHLEGILAWVSSRQTNGFLAAINGLFQAAKRKARGYRRFRTIRTVIVMIAGKRDFSCVNPYFTA